MLGGLEFLHRSTTYGCVPQVPTDCRPIPEEKKKSWLFEVIPGLVNNITYPNSQVTRLPTYLTYLGTLPDYLVDPSNIEPSRPVAQTPKLGSPLEIDVS